MKALKLQIHGKVQGVGYRRWFEQRAIALGLKGYVKNLPNGDVEAVICGTEDDVNQLLEISMEGPLHAKVHHIECAEPSIEASACHSFQI